MNQSACSKNANNTSSTWNITLIMIIMTMTYIVKTFYMEICKVFFLFFFQEVFDSEHENMRVLALCSYNIPNKEKNGWPSQKTRLQTHTLCQYISKRFHFREWLITNSNLTNFNLLSVKTIFFWRRGYITINSIPFHITFSIHDFPLNSPHYILNRITCPVRHSLVSNNFGARGIEG